MNDMRMSAATTATTIPHYVVLDTETTGLFDFKAPADAEHQPRLATFAAVLTDADGNEIDRVSLYVKPDGWSINGTQAAEVNGLTDEVLRERGVPIHDVLSLWNHWIDAGATMVAFNADFDTKVMRGELRRAGLPDRFEATKRLCVMKALKPYAKQGLAVKGAGFVKLETACAFFGITNEAAHTAMADAEAAFHVLRRLMMDGHIAGNPDLGQGQIPRDIEAPPPAGHNMPPEEITEAPPHYDPIDEAVAPYSGLIDEATNWLDGSPVENEDQMKAVDELLRGIKEARKAVTTAEESACKPLYEAWKGEKARWKPTVDDLDRMVKGLASLVDGFKRKLAAEKEAARRRAFEEAEAARRAAEEVARQANIGDIEARREAAAAAEEARRAQMAAQAAKKDTVKGLRTVFRHEINDHRAALNWIIAHDRDAVTAFIDAYVAKNFREKAIAGVTVTELKEAF